MRAALLELLRGALARDRGTPGFIGRIAIGVEIEARQTWLDVLFDDRARTTFVESPHPRARFALLLDGAAADAILRGRPIPKTSRIFLDGDTNLMGRFVSRYLEVRDLLSIRSGGRR